MLHKGLSGLCGNAFNQPRCALGPRRLRNLLSLRQTKAKDTERGKDAGE